MISVLTYHQIDHVEPADDPLGISVTPESFSEQMTYLHNNDFTCLSLSEAVTYWETKKTPPTKAFILTFDDGYRDLYTTVYPILEPLGFTATIFLVADQVGGHSNWVGQGSQPLLNWNEIHELRSAGFTFDSHTLSHRRLTTLDEAEVTREVKQSKEIIEQNLGEEVNFISYPYNDHNPRIQDIVASSGYRAACAGERQPWNLYNIWRMRCEKKDTLRRFSWKARGSQYHIIRLRQHPLIHSTGRQVKKFLLRK